jgi:hypothetical protein
VGFITKLTIGGVDLTPDTIVKNPLKPTDDLQVLAVIRNVLWELGVTDSVYVGAQLSMANRQRLISLIFGTMTNLEVLFQLAVFEYDPGTEAYFKCFHGHDTDMKGVLEKNGDELNLAIADDPSDEVQAPQNYTFTIGIKPQPALQTFTVALSPKQKIVKRWGLGATD